MTQSTETTPEEAERARRRKLLIVTLFLLFGLPIYIIVAAGLVAWLNAPVEPAGGGPAARPLHWAVEVVIYLGLGLVWALPLKRLVQGLGRPAS